MENDNSADASPQSQNFNNWLRQMFGRAPVLGNNTLQFNEDYARAIGIPEAEIQRRKKQQPLMIGRQSYSED